MFLDRDGVITEPVLDTGLATPESPYHPSDVALIDGAADAIRGLRGVGWLVVGVSNQPAAAKGTATLDQLADVAARARTLLSEAGADLDDWRYCHHHPRGAVAELSGPCDCRKPAPGMLVAAAAAHGIDLSASWMVGDSDTDVETGRRAGCRTILVEHPGTGHRRRGSELPTLTAPDLPAAASLIGRSGAKIGQASRQTRS